MINKEKSDFQIFSSHDPRAQYSDIKTEYLLGGKIS